MSVALVTYTLELLRNTIIADATISARVGTNVYPQHVSSVDKPVFPCVTMHVVANTPTVEIPTMRFIIVQFDVWFESDKDQTSDLAVAHEQLGTLFHRTNLKNANVKIKNIVQRFDGPQIRDPDGRRWHFPSRFDMHAVAA